MYKGLPSVIKLAALCDISCYIACLKFLTWELSRMIASLEPDHNEYKVILELYVSHFNTENDEFIIRKLQLLGRITKNNTIVNFCECKSLESFYYPLFFYKILSLFLL